MVGAANIIAHLRRRFPHPEPDPEWVSQCMAALIEDGQAATSGAVEMQYVWSDLGLSTRHVAGTGIPIPQNDEGGDLHNITLFFTPTLVQIHSIAEIGASAFTLKTTLEQRRDIISGATRIRRLEDEEEDATQAAKEKGPPPYARSMLSLLVSDGRTALRAIEYRRIPELTLGVTPLGTKLLLHKVRCLRGTLLLEPENCTFFGGAVDALESGQPTAFVNALEERLEAARNGTAGGGALPPPTRRRTLPTNRRAGAAAPNPNPNRPPRRAAATAPATRTGSSDAARAARLAAIQAALPSSAPAPAPVSAAPPVLPPPRPRAPVPVDDSDTTFDDDSFDVDDSFIQHLDAAEAAASWATKERPGRPVPRTSARRDVHEQEVIYVSD